MTSESLFGYESDGIQMDSSLDYPGRLQEKVILPDTSSILESSLQVRFFLFFHGDAGKGVVPPLF